MVQSEIADVSQSDNVMSSQRKMRGPHLREALIDDCSLVKKAV